MNASGCFSTARSRGRGAGVSRRSAAIAKRPALIANGTGMSEVRTIERLRLPPGIHDVSCRRLGLLGFSLRLDFGDLGLDRAEMVVDPRERRLEIADTVFWKVADRDLLEMHR